MNAPATTKAVGADDGPQRVTSLELFFDLVFVFTITQLSTLLTGELTPTGMLRILLIFGVAWWMYGGYAWLANTAVHHRIGQRLLLLSGMAGFLVVALATPRAFGPDGVALGLGYLTVVCVHGALYAQANRNIFRVVPFNLTSAVLVIVAGLLDGPARYGAWAAAVAVQVLSPLLIRPGGRFDIRPAHFVERHSGLIIIALGESIVAIGIGLGRRPITWEVAGVALLGLAVSASLWWVFFGTGDDEHAEGVMTAAPPQARPRMALTGYFYAYIPILTGIVVFAAGIKRSIGHSAEAAPGPSMAIGGGVALFLGGAAVFRRALRIGPMGSRLAAAGATLATTAIGALLAVAVQLLAIAGIIALMLAAEQGRRPREEAHSGLTPDPQRPATGRG